MTAPRPSSELLKVKQVAERLNCSEPYVYALVDRRELPCVRLGRAIRVEASAVERFISARKIGL